MTTTVVNNLVFRAFFEKQRLTGPNFIDWYRNLRIVLSVEDKLSFLEQPIPVMPVLPAGQSKKGPEENSQKYEPQLAARENNQGKGKYKLAYAPKPKISPPPKKDYLTKAVICHQCGDVGHWKRNCPQYLAKLLKNKKLSQGASTSDIRANRILVAIAAFYDYEICGDIKRELTISCYTDAGYLTDVDDLKS
uniref:Zinc finger, CCHC-type n=1 Tax=Tanacetum cinerariifolium TaxID=118510 RepID=A0A699GPV6_TANCI|nr:zinc finger, CCHC-type [Tanacetum cinerariifolium]